jgi:hypothetical protein
MGIEEMFETRNMLDIIAHNKKIQMAFLQAEHDLAMRIAIMEMKTPTKIFQGSFYKINKGLEKQVNKILTNLNNDIQAGIKDGIATHWDMANLKNNKMVGAWADGIKLSKEAISTSFNQVNMAALDTFVTRTTDGMNLSRRVWMLTSAAKDQLELYLASGIATGRSAAGIATNLKEFLNEPNRLFRRVRKEGKLVLSKSARGYHPGAGIYRSSFKNALRLSRTEINMAYRMSDYMRRQQLPFVTGIEVHLSASHPRMDICDDLVGKYPKGFIFIGWHPICLCYTTDILLNKKDSLKFMKTGKVPKSKYISRLPRRATNWLKKNASKIAKYKNTPYFIRDNLTKDFALREHVLRTEIPAPIPTPPGADLQLLRVSEFNKKYADASIEHCIAVDKKGNIVLSKSGAKNYINFTEAEFRQMNVDNMLFTHNHPSGSSFSNNDIQMLGAYKRGSEIRAIGTEYQYSAKIINAGKFPHSTGAVKDLYNIENTALQSKYQAIYEKKRISFIETGFSREEAATIATKLTSLEHTHEAMEAFAKKFGIEYKRWLNK